MNLTAAQVDTIRDVARLLLQLRGLVGQHGYIPIQKRVHAAWRDLVDMLETNPPAIVDVVPDEDEAVPDNPHVPRRGKAAQRLMERHLP